MASPNEHCYSEDELWQAFQYVCGDLSDAACESFEVAMADRPELAEAVAEAVRLTRLVAGTESEKQSPRPVVPVADPITPVAPRRLIQSAATVATALCCVVLMITISAFQSLPEPQSVVADDSEDAELLVSAWVDTTENDSAGDFDSETGADELDVPDWMLVAVCREFPGHDEDGGHGPSSEKEWF